MKFSIVFIMLLLLTSIFALAQHAKKDDVLYLKNGSIIRGKIIDHAGDPIKIISAEGNMYVYPKSDVDHITQEPKWNSFTYKQKGFAHFTELGPLVAGKTNIDGVTTAAFSFQTVNGYKFNQFAMLGAGVGVDLYATQTIIPVFGSFRGDILRSGTVLPYYFVDMGYGINITQNSPAISDFKGGFSWAAGLGAKIPFNKTAGFLISFGYRYQKTSYTQGGLKNDVSYNRLAIRAGFFL